MSGKLIKSNLAKVETFLEEEYEMDLKRRDGAKLWKFFSARNIDSIVIKTHQCLLVVYGSEVEKR